MNDMPDINRDNESYIARVWTDRETFPHCTVVFDGLRVREVRPAVDRLVADLAAASVRARHEVGVYAEVR